MPVILPANGFAQAALQVLRQCGNDLSRDNVMKQAANLHKVELDNLLPRRNPEYQSHQLLSDRPDADVSV